MKIAIVDDCRADRDIIINKLDSFAMNRHIDFNIKEFSTAESFLAEFEPRMFDIAFLDIHMGQLTGMDAARQIYKSDPRCRIIFMTCSEDFLRQSYSVRATYYLVKPVIDEEFLQAMEFCNIKPQHAVPFLGVKINGRSMQLDTSQVLYIDVALHTVSIHFRDKDVELSQSFLSVAKLLESDDRFVLSARGIMVNLQHVTDLKQEYFLMDNGEKIPVSRRNKSTMKNAWHDYRYNSLEITKAADS